MDLDPRELELRHQTYDWLHKRYLHDADTVAEHDAGWAARRVQAPPAVALVDALRRSGDAAAFRDGLNLLTSPKDSALSLSGPNGQLMVNQLVNYSTDQARIPELH